MSAPQDFQQLINQLSESDYQKLCVAVETGKWPNGVSLTEQQQASTLQLVLAYQAKHLDSSEYLTINADGFINQPSKYILKRQFQQQESIKRFKQDDL